MNRSLLAMLILLSSASADDLSIQSPESQGMSSEKLKEVDATMQGLLEQKRLAGGVILVAKNGNIVYFNAFGKKDIKADTPMTTDAIFRIYSMSKGITSAAIMMLVDEGKVDLEAPIAKYVPEFKDVKVWKDGAEVEAERPPTVRDLLRHTAGLTYGVFGNSEIDQKYRAAGVLSPWDSNEVMAAKVGKIPLEYQPGKGWKYSVSIDVLGRIVEVASGRKFSKFLQDRIFDPLGMVDTAFHVSADKLDRFATNYNSDGKGTLTVGDPPSGQFSKPKAFESGGGGLTSTTMDYFRFLNMIASGGKHGGKQLISEKSIELMTTNQLPKEAGWVRFGDEVREGVGYGLGFNVRTKMSAWDPGGRVGEYGWGGAASTHYWVSPKDNLIVITMEQVMPYSFMTEFAVKKTIYDAIK